MTFHLVIIPEHGILSPECLVICNMTSNCSVIFGGYLVTISEWLNAPWHG